MTKYMIITDNGDSDKHFIGQVIPFTDLIDINTQLLTQGKRPIKAYNELLSLEEVSGYSGSFLAAASFQYTKKRLVNSLIKGQVDNLTSIKENQIIGKLIPVGTSKRDLEVMDEEAKSNVFKFQC